MRPGEVRVLCLRLAAASATPVDFYLDQTLEELVRWALAAQQAFPREE